MFKVTNPLDKLTSKGVDDLLARLFIMEPTAEVNLHIRYVEGKMYCEGFWRRKESDRYTADVFVAGNTPSVVVAKLVVDAVKKATEGEAPDA